MSTLQELRHDLTQTWDQVRDGWHRLNRQAAATLTGALTRFTHGRRDPSALTPAERRNIWDTAGRDWWTPGGGLGWGILAAEVIDEDDRVLVRLEAPGLDKDDLDLEVRDGYLMIRGEKRLDRERSQGRYRVTECAYGRFERTIALPDAVRSDQASARYRKGVLQVELPKDPARPRRTLRVQVH